MVIASMNPIFNILSMEFAQPCFPNHRRRKKIELTNLCDGINLAGCIKNIPDRHLNIAPEICKPPLTGDAGAGDAAFRL